MKKLKRTFLMKIKDFFSYTIPDLIGGRKKIFWFIHFPIILILFILFIGSFVYVKWYYSWLNQKEEVFTQLKAFKHHILVETDSEYRKRYGDIGVGTRLKNFGFPSKIYDINNVEIGEFSEERRIYVSLSNVSDLFIKSLLATEDANFMEHSGVDYRALLRAVYYTLIYFSRQGGSSITQQLSKLLFTQRELNVKRKVFEMFCAKAIESQHTKREILLMYVNLIFFGHGANGIEYASQLYFNKSAKDLNLGEASFLAAIILNPTHYSPYRNRTIAKNRHLRVLRGIQERIPEILQGKSPEEIHREFWATYVFDTRNLRPRFTLRSSYAPYVIETVRRELSKTLSAEELLRGGYKIYTTIDVDLQKAAKEEIQRGIKQWRDHLNKNPRLKKIANEFEGALISVDPRTSQIKAIVGGYEFTPENQLNRVYQAKRQLGSAFKPFVYLSALDLEAYTPWSLVSDRPLKMKVRGSTGRWEDWEVGNGMNRYMLDIPATKALEISSNVAVVRVIHKIGMKRLQEIMRRALGISREEAERRFPDKVWSLALGTTEMTPLEVATAYGALANHGRSIKPYLIRRVQDSQGNVLFNTPENHAKDGELIANKRESIYLIREMMRKVVTGQHGTGSTARHNAPGIEFVGKTGSTQKHRDQWFVGFNNELCTIVWFGNDKNETLTREMFGGTVAAPVWGRYMKKASNVFTFSHMDIPADLNIVKLKIDSFNGLVAKNNQDEGVETGLFISGTEPGDYSDWSESRRKWVFLSPEELHKIDQNRDSSSSQIERTPEEIQFENSTDPRRSEETGNNSQRQIYGLPDRQSNRNDSTEIPDNSFPVD